MLKQCIVADRKVALLTEGGGFKWGHPDPPPLNPGGGPPGAAAGGVARGARVYAQTARGAAAGGRRGAP